ncbi:MAG: UvrD-helicase domain-containing protein [Candidatus Thiodiazotropha endolucinida]
MFAMPPVDNRDIRWACEVLGLPPTAFHGEDGNDPRAAVLLSNETLDIEACPGSGKTTLLVAKLAILARKWKSRRSGICVLSHTNAARREIERSLGRTAAGVALLSYPHYIGTIHGFVNEFLAIPWLRSLGYLITVIDDALCEQHRRRLLSFNQYGALRTTVANREQHPDANFVGNWHVASPDFLVLKENGNQVFMDPNRPAALQLCRLARQCTEDGYYRYEELFMWAEDLLDKHPEAVATIRQRFPLLFIDEVQDNSELQSRFLQRIFIAGDDPVIRQRYGDSNQAIYSHNNASGAESDPFPIAEIRHDIPNSHRFSQQIADLANPLGLNPQDLLGLGPPAHTIQSDTAGSHAIILFDDDSMGCVLGCYASYLREMFSEDELAAGLFTAVGGVHRPGDDTNVPRFVAHYWPEYDHELSYAEPRPKTFHQYIAAGWKAAGIGGDAHAVVERIADGIYRAVQIATPAMKRTQYKRKHRLILELLEEAVDLKERYLALVMRIINDETDIEPEEWQGIWVPLILQLVELLSGAEINPAHLDEFLVWPDEELDGEVSRKIRRKDNVYRFPSDTPAVEVRVGSIHSVKGETHTATLVLDTFFYDHHLNALRPWLLGEKTGQGTEGTRMQSRLKQHYVAFTRPTHLLAIAMRDNLSAQEIAVLKDRNWRVGRAQQDGSIAWL